MGGEQTTIEITEKAFYKGETKEGRANGKGIISFENKEIIFGTFESETIHNAHV